MMRAQSTRKQRPLEVQYTSKPVSGWGGFELVAGFFRAIGLREVLARALPDGRISNNQVPVVDMVVQFFVMVLEGGSRFEHMERVRCDEVVRRIMGITRMGSASSLLRYLKELRQSQSELVHTITSALTFDLMGLTHSSDIIDLDSTVFTRDGQQEGSSKGYNPKRPGGRSHHPLLAMFARTKLIAHAWLRAGSASPHRGCQEFVIELLERLPKTFRVEALRADSGFYSRGFMELLELRRIPYVIAAKMSRPFERWCHGVTGFVPINRHFAVAEASYLSSKWDRPRRMIVIRKTTVQRRGMLFDVPQHEFQAFVTTLECPPEQAWRFYLQRGDCENRIKELKYSFNADSFCLHCFTGTEVAFRLICFLFNLMAMFKTTILLDPRITLATVRSKIFVIGASIGRIARNDVLRLGLTGRWRTEFEKLRHRAAAWASSTAAQLNKLFHVHDFDAPSCWRARPTAPPLSAY